MADESKIRSGGPDLLNALLDEDEDALGDAPYSMLGWQVLAVVSSLLTVAVYERFGSPVSVDELSKYATSIPTDSEGYPRRVVVEAVLRAGAGDRRILTGLPDDEILETTPIVVRWMVSDLVPRVTSRERLIDRAVELAVLQPVPDLDE